MMLKKINSFVGILTVGRVVFALGVPWTAAAAVNETPNIVLILADDLGWRDTSLYGSTFYQTPNIDRLSERAMMFTEAYSSHPSCSPTRASILTGLWPARIGITSTPCHLPQVTLKPSIQEKFNPAYKAIPVTSATRLSLEHFTLAEALKTVGYRTGHFGKWHVGREPYDPLHHGFDVDLPHYAGPGPAGSYIAPWAFPEDIHFIGQRGEHIEDRMAEEAVRFIKEAKGRPFFLNYWCFSVHAPYDAKPSLIEHYRGLADPENPQRNPMMAAMVQSLDDAVGTLMKTLEEEGLLENTIIIFASDNGGNMYDRVGNLPPTNNSPLRGGKGNIHEGGVRGPLLVAWPGVVKGGTWSRELVQSTDFYPTILEMLKLDPQQGQVFDGISMVPALTGGTLERDTLFWFNPNTGPHVGGIPSVSVRRGDWKLIRFFYDGDPLATGGFAHRYELFNLKYDLGECNNLAAKKPELLADLDALIEGFLEESGALLPVPNPDYNPVEGAQRPDRETINMNAAYAEPFPDPEAPKKPSPSPPAVVQVKRDENGGRYVVSPAGFVSIRGGKHSSENQSGQPLSVQRKDDAEGYRAILIQYDLTEVPQESSLNSVIRYTAKAFDHGSNHSFSIYAVENDWDAQSVTFDTAPRKMEKIRDLTRGTGVNGSIAFPVTGYMQKHLKDKKVSFLIEMRSAPGFSRPVEFYNSPMLEITKAQVPHYVRADLLRPVWKGSRIENETVLPTSYDGHPAEANLAFIPSAVIRVKNYALNKIYEEGKDYTFDGRTLRLTAHSSIPFFKYETLYHNNPNAKPSVMKMLDGGYLTFSESAMFNDKQLAVTYEHGDAWDGPIPAAAPKSLPKTFAKLKAGRPLKLMVFGDSISAGASASGFCSRPPWMPRWADLVVDELRRAYGSEIDYINPSLGGTRSEWGRSTVDGLVSFEKPDLVILGFGMNDGGVSTEQFMENHRAMMESIRKQNPAVEFVLLMSFQPNSRWFSLKRQKGYLEAFRNVDEPGVAVADVWSVHGYLLKHKTYWDMTGNHVNHPNDFMVRIYAQILLATLGIE